MSARLVIVLDTCVLINLFNGDCMGLLESLPRFDFRITTHVREEIEDERQTAVLEALLEQGAIKLEEVTDQNVILEIEHLARTVGIGEASCIALAAEKGWCVGTDDGLARGMVAEELGSGRILTTPGLLFAAVSEGQLDVKEADEIKDRLAQSRFEMDFESFADLLNGDYQGWVRE